MLFMLSSEFLRIDEIRGCAIVQIAVTRPVVISTTKTQPGTSPDSSFIINSIRSRIAPRYLPILICTFTTLRRYLLDISTLSFSLQFLQRLSFFTFLNILQMMNCGKLRNHHVTAKCITNAVSRA